MIAASKFKRSRKAIPLEEMFRNFDSEMTAFGYKRFPIGLLCEIID